MDNKNLDYITQIVCAYVAKNTVSTDQVLKFTLELQTLFNKMQKNQNYTSPAINIKKSIQPNYLICLEDGVKKQVLTRYLKNKYNLTPEQYRAKWQLPADYPMSAPNYSAKRSKIAKEKGLGRN